MKILLKIACFTIAALLMTGCETIGNGKLDVPETVNIGDGKLFGSENAYNIAISLGQVAVYKKPALAHSAISKLNNVKGKVSAFEEKYSISQAADIVGGMLLEECGIYCQTVAGQKYVVQVKAKLDEFRAIDDSDVTVTLHEFLDTLLAHIQAIPFIPVEGHEVVESAQHE